MKGEVVDGDQAGGLCSEHGPQVLKSRRREHIDDELQRENKRLIDEREYEIQKITELKEDELEKLQAAIKTQYAPSKSKVVDDVFSTSDRLAKSGDDLSRRVAEHLGDDEFNPYSSPDPH